MRGRISKGKKTIFLLSKVSQIDQLDPVSETWRVRPAVLGSTAEDGFPGRDEPREFSFMEIAPEISSSKHPWRLLPKQQKPSQQN